MPDILKFPSIVPNGIYRLRSAAYSPNLYLEWVLDSQIAPRQLDAGDTKQQWKITAQADDIYTIVNVNSQSPLSIIDYTEKDDTGKDVNKQRLGAGHSQQWTIEPRGDQWVIGVIENGTCIDLANNTVPIIWERNNHVNQHWILEIVDSSGKDGGSAIVALGNYIITNVGTSCNAVVWAGYEKEFCHVNTWPNSPAEFANRAWVIIPVPGGYQITKNYPPAGSLRWLKDGPAVTTTPNVCRLVPVPNTQYFHIALGPKSDAEYLMDDNNGAQLDHPTSNASFNATDPHQQWSINPYSPGWS